MRRCAFLLLPLLAALVAPAAGCGGRDGDRAPRGAATATPGRAPSAPPATRAPALDPDAARVIRAWADTLRRGDVRGAARRFALPAIVANSTGPARLETRRAVRAFNRTLPCGAVVTSVEPGSNDLAIATFRLMERPGAGVCGSGSGGRAQVAFRIRDGLIAAWLRVGDPAAAGDAIEA